MRCALLARYRTDLRDMWPQRQQAAWAAAAAALLLPLLLDGSSLGAAAASLRLEARDSWRKPVQWFHIHKAGGSTICALAKRMGERVVAPDVNCDSPHLQDLYEQRFEKRRTTCEDRKAHFESGGFTWGAVETHLDAGAFCAGDFLNAVALREPIDRLESQVNYRVDEPYLEGPCRYDVLISHLQAGNVTRELERECWQQLPIFDNYVTRVLAGSDVMSLPAGGVSEAHFERARAALQRFDLVVPMETLLSDSRALLHLNRALGWSLQPEDLRHRYSWTGQREPAGLGHEAKFTEEQLRFLRHLNRFDLELYSAALEQYQAGLATLDP